MKNIFKTTLICIVLVLMGVLNSVMAQLSANTVKYKITYDATTQLYTTWVIPDYAVPNANNSGTTEKGGTAQFTIVVPKDFVITEITDIKGTWAKPTDAGFIKLGPGNTSQTWTSLDPALNYYVVGKTPSETDYGTFAVGVPVSLFSFKGNGCFGPVKPLPPNDPFIAAADNAYSLNVGNSFYSRSGQPAGGNVVPLEQFVNITGTPANCSILANPDAQTVAATGSTLINILPNDKTGDGTVATLTTVTAPTITAQPTKGTVTVKADGSIDYVPNAGATGTDTFVYQICDKVNTTVCDTAKVTVTITAIPVKPVIYAYDDNNVTNKGVAVSGNVLINDDKATGTSPLVVTTTPIMQPTNGTLVLNANGSYTYTPNATYTGIDTFKYRVCDSGSSAVCDTALVTINILDPTATNRPPVALTDNATTPTNTPVSGNVLTNDSDPDAAQTLTATIVTQPAHGTVTLNPNGSYTYTPTAGYTGNDVFTYKACDNGVPQLCTNATVNIGVGAAANFPITNADLATRCPSCTATGNVLTNDILPSGSVLNTTPIVAPTNGTVVLNADGTFTYTPNTGYTGPDQFIYEVCTNATPKQCSQSVVFIIPKSVAVGTADLRISKKLVTSAPFVVGQTVTYSIVVANLGAANATNVVVKDSVGTGLQILGGTPTAGNFANPLWNIPSISAGDSVTLTLTAKVLAEGISFNYAKIVQADQNDPLTSNNDVAVCLTVPIKLCVGHKVEASVSSIYTNVVWFKDGQQVGSGNTILLSEIGAYNFTATNVTCPASGCCPIVIEAADNCCPVQICVPVTIVKKKK